MINERHGTAMSLHEMSSRILRERVAELTRRFLAGKQPDFLRQHSRALDDYFERAFESSMIGPRMQINKNPYAIVALGGYGREEQCIYSDVDLLFLFARRVPSDAENLIREMIYPLWDIGMEVGYATRSVKECLALAGADLNVLTPLLDARFVCGMSMLFSELMTQLRDRVIRKRRDRLMDQLLAATRGRHAQYGDSAYLLEPNLKEGQGGLRDYHAMLWMAHLETDLRQPRDLEFFGLLSNSEYLQLQAALDFIWAARNHLHHLSGRKVDRLHFETQLRIAENLKYRAEAGQQPVERFLGELHGRMEEVKRQHLLLQHELGVESRGRRRRSGLKTPVEGIEMVSWGMLSFSGPEAVLKRPELLVRIFEESAVHRAPLSPEAKRLVSEFLYLVDERFRSAAEIVRAFERILKAPDADFSVLDDLHTTGFLEAFIPEFASISNRIQYDEYHLYPVDKHLLRTVQTLKHIAGAEGVGEPLAGRVYRDLRSKVVLAWAALLHDVGKGDPQDDHAVHGADIVRRILTEKGLTAGEVDTAAFLVREHLFLIKTATRRDIHDEETAVACARRIMDIERLKMLYVLTVADSLATGPAAWNDWTAHLLRELFLKVLNVLERGELASEEAVAVIERKRAAVLASAASDEERRELEGVFPVFPPRYLLSVPAEAIIAHIPLYRRLGEREFVWEIHPSAEGATRTVTICAKDRPGLIASMAGVFTLNNINILGVQIFTWRNRVALDVFEVTPPPDAIFEADKWLRAEDNLRAVLTGALDLKAALKDRLDAGRTVRPKGVRRAHRVKVDNSASSFFTIVDVFTYDSPGLLYRVADALFRCGLDISVAKIATKVDQVVDVFYVRDINGQKVDAPERVSAVKDAVLACLPRLE
jgi:[protein-PII] uridylyltransferase